MFGSRGSTRSAFTLLEILVVVAIIALLVSILVPSLSGAKKQGRQLRCLTNMNQFGKAALFYAEIYKGWVIANESQENFIPKRGTPRDYPRDDSYSHTQFAISLLNGLLFDHPVKGIYKDNDQAGMIKACRSIPQFQCPTHPDKDQALDYIVNGFVQQYSTENCQRDQSYLKFREVRDRVEGVEVVDLSFFHRVDAFRADTGRRIYVIEGHQKHWTDDLRFHDMFYTSHLPGAGQPRVATDKRHPGGITALFFDGHAQVMRQSKIDEGYPNTIGTRLRFFTDVPEKYR